MNAITYWAVQKMYDSYVSTYVEYNGRKTLKKLQPDNTLRNKGALSNKNKITKNYLYLLLHFFSKINYWKLSISLAHRIELLIISPREQENKFDACWLSRSTVAAKSFGYTIVVLRLCTYLKQACWFDEMLGKHKIK